MKIRAKKEVFDEKGGFRDYITRRPILTDGSSG